MKTHSRTNLFVRKQHPTDPKRAALELDFSDYSSSCITIYEVGLAGIKGDYYPGPIEILHKYKCSQCDSTHALVKDTKGKLLCAGCAQSAGVCKNCEIYAYDLKEGSCQSCWNKYAGLRS
jgi:hypothetical protein